MNACDSKYLDKSFTLEERMILFSLSLFPEFKHDDCSKVISIIHSFFKFCVWDVTILEAGIM